MWECTCTKNCNEVHFDKFCQLYLKIQNSERFKFQFRVYKQAVVTGANLPLFLYEYNFTKGAWLLVESMFYSYNSR